MTAIYVPGRKIVLGVIGGLELLTSSPLVDPSSAGVAAPVGSVYMGNGTTYVKTGAGDTAWLAYATATSVAPISDGIYGNGFNGAITDAGNRTLTESLATTNWTIDPGVIITPARFVIICNGTLTIGAGAAIRQNGVNGAGTVGGTGGGVGAAGLLGVGSAGGNGGTPPAGGGGGTASSQQPRGIGTVCQGGAAGAGGAGGAMTQQAATSGCPFMVGPQIGFFPNVAITPVNGGSGGGGGASGGASGNGGGGGGGGGVVVIVAKNVVNNGAIEAKGGNGANGTANNGNGGAGGGGGKVIVVCRTYTGTAPDVSGGTGGTGVGTGTNGNPGNTGLASVMTF